MKNIAQLFTLLDLIQQKLGWLPPLLARFTTGWIFLWAGWGKLNNLEGVVEFFTELGIPAASIQAPFIASLEFVGGAMLLAGLGTRFFSVMLSGTMVVALLTALRDDIESLGDLFSRSEFLYIALFAYLLVQGAGVVSADHFLRRRIAAAIQNSDHSR